LVHEGAHLPFEADVTSILFSQQPPYRITVAVNNTLTPTTLPCGTVEYLSGPMYVTVVVFSIEHLTQDVCIPVYAYVFSKSSEYIPSYEQ